MAPSKDSEVLEESAGSGSNTAATVSGSSAEAAQGNESSGSRLSPVAVLQVEEDDPLYKREVIKKPYTKYESIMKSYTSSEIYEDSDVSNDGGGRTMGHYMGLLFDRRTYIYLFKRYQHSAVKFRNSKRVYILQILLILLPFSAIWMGGKYSGSCPGSPDLVHLASITGIFGSILVGQWMVMKCCSPEDRPCEGQQKSFILIFFVLVVFMLELEIYHFTKQPLSFQPGTVNYCSKVFYDYTYYKFIAAFGSMFFVVLLYFPDYRSFSSDLSCAAPNTNSCYDAMSEDDDRDACRMC